jgi:hypothetical protein
MVSTLGISRCAGEDAAPLTDEALLLVAQKAAEKENAEARVARAGSHNPHLGEMILRNPLSNFLIFAVRIETKSAPRIHFMTVDRSGKTTSPFSAADYGTLVARADRANWKDADYLDAARLLVHLPRPHNEDGCVFPEKPEDFTAIKFNMASVGLGVDKQAEASKQIAPPKIEVKDKDAVIAFYAWHLIGGHLCQWTVQVGTVNKATMKDLGGFGGGGYD